MKKKIVFGLAIFALMFLFGCSELSVMVVSLLAVATVVSTVLVLVVVPSTVETLTRGRSLGKLALAQKQPDEAKRQFLRARDISPSSSRPHVALGQLAMKQGQQDEAVDQFHQAIRLEPKREDTIRMDAIQPLHHPLAGVVIDEQMPVSRLAGKCGDTAQCGHDRRNARNDPDLPEAVVRRGCHWKSFSSPERTGKPT